MSTDTSPYKITLPGVRLAFPDLFEATQVQGTGTPSYRATFLVPADGQTRKKVDTIIKQLAKDTWKDKAEKILASVDGIPNKICWIDGNKRAYDGYEDNWALSATRRTTAGRPTVVDVDRSPLQADDGKPYSGCYVNAIVKFWAQDNEHGKAIRCELLGVQFFKDGDSFGGGTKAADTDDFEDLSTGVEAEDIA
jgi:hypothetical protein